MNLRPSVRQPTGEPREPVEATTAAHEHGSVAPRVVACRRRLGLSQTNLALAIGWTDRTVRRLERGELPWVRAIEEGLQPTADELRKLRALAQQLHIELDDLLRPADVAPMAAVLPLHQEVAPREQDASDEEPWMVRGREIRWLNPARPDPAELGALPTTSTPASRSRLRPALWCARGRVVGAALAGVLPSMLARTSMPGLAGAASAAVVVGGAAVVGTGHLLTPSPSPASRVTPAAPPITAHHVAPATGGGQTAVPPAASNAAPPPSTIAPAITVAIPDPVPPAAPRVHTAAVVVSRHLVGPVAFLSTSAIDFGWVPVDSSASRTVTLTNTGDSPLHVSHTTLLMTADISATQDSCAGRILAPGQRCAVTLTYAPHRSGMLAPSAQLGFVDDAPGIGGGQVVALAGATRD
ncbi:MAG: Abnormal spindle-like microcephaly-assocd, ASPM-SPD-2-Hydin [Chloroflexi bacterium]|nr:Abnormal spindle-like microcephaly-assocd, ASPM-SPD-2-Hydin [Chloroflexota bacterium]